MASSVLFHIRLFQLNNHLKSSYPEVWKVFGTGNQELSLLGRYSRMTKLSTQYQVSDAELNGKLIVLRRLHQSGGIGVLVIVLGAVYEVMS